MTPNLDLLDKTLHHIETLDAFGDDVDDRWEQGWWAGHVRDEDWNICGTSACFAGWACHLAGDTLVPDRGAPRSVAPDGSTREVMYRAQELLGLDHVQASRLFRGSNDLDRLRELVAAIKDEA